MTSSRRVRLGVVLASASCLVLAGVAAAGCVMVGLSWRAAVDTYELTNTALGLMLALCGAVIAWAVPRSAIGWLLVVGGTGHLLTAALTPLAWLVVRTGGSETLSRWLATIASQAWGLGVVGLFLIAMLLFPDGRLPARGWRVVVVLQAVSIAGQAVTGVLSPIPLLGQGGIGLVSVFALPADVPQPALDALGLLSSLLTLAVLASLVVRYVRGDDRVRRQVQWLILAIVLITVLNLQRFVTGDGPIPLLLTFGLVPVAIAIAIIRYGLLDIRLVLSRTLVYALLIAVVAATYAGIVAALALLLPRSSDRASTVAAAIVVAFAFTPLRLLMQRTVGRALYGSRDDPAGVASRLGNELASASDTLDQVLELARQELRLPFLALDDGGGDRVARAGTLQGAAVLVQLPGPDGGALAVGLRSGEEALHDADRRVLALLAAPLVVALRALALNAAVAAARTEVVTERERERQRLQRELHDGVGPQLTGVAFRLDAAANLAGSSPDRAGELLREARTDLREAIATVRDVVHELRPIDLETDGLVESLRTRVSAISAGAGVPVVLHAVLPLPERSAALDLAAYRIVVEAVTNTVRHSPGSRCRVTIAAEAGGLHLEVSDDGVPAPEWRPGVGLTSMRHRAEELGGRLEAGPSPSGWCVVAQLPVPLPSGALERLTA